MFGRAALAAIVAGSVFIPAATVQTSQTTKIRDMILTQAQHGMRRARRVNLSHRRCTQLNLALATPPPATTTRFLLFKSTIATPPVHTTLLVQMTSIIP